MNRPHILCILLFATALFESCSDFGSEVIPVPLLGIEPNSGRIGSVVAIHGAHFKASASSYAIRFLGANDTLIPDSSSESTIYTFVPFGARSGSLEIYSNDFVGITGEFSVILSPDPNALTLQPYDISPPITAKDSVVVDRMGISRRWRMDFQGDTVHLSRSYSSGEEAYEYHVVLLDQGPGQLPRVVSLWIRIQPDYPGYWIDPIPVGVLKLQQYDRHGVIAGRFFGRPSVSRMRNGSFTIWAENRQ
jgi:hypothetical protein